MNIKIGEMYYNEFWGNVYRIIVDGDDDAGILAYDQDGTDEKLINLHLMKLSDIYWMDAYRIFYTVLLEMQAMFPGKRVEGHVQDCADKNFWIRLGGHVYPDPDDECFTIFELELDYED